MVRPKTSCAPFRTAGTAMCRCARLIPALELDEFLLSRIFGVDSNHFAAYPLRQVGHGTILVGITIEVFELHWPENGLHVGGGQGVANRVTVKFFGALQCVGQYIDGGVAFNFVLARGMAIGFAEGVVEGVEG